MKKLVLFFIISALVLAVSAPAAYSAENEKLDSLIKECAIIFEEVMEMPEKGIPGKLLVKSTGIAIFPSTIKGAFFVGGRYGEGVVIYRDPKTRKWSPPAFFNVSGVSFGWQIGGEAIDLIFVIPTERGFEGMLKNRLNIGTNTAIVAGPIGRHTEMGADITLKGGIFTYSRAKGLFAGMGLKGVAINPNKGDNNSYYGENLSVKDILMSGNVVPTPAGKELINTVSKYTK